MSQLHVNVLAVDGAPFRTTVHQGRTYIGGVLGQRYEISVRNNDYTRIAAVCTVDGRNVLDGKPGTYEGQALIIGGSSIGKFDGWRTSLSEVAAFRLTDASESYASKRGDGSNIGVIGVAVFKEKTKVREPVYRSASAVPAAHRLLSADVERGGGTRSAGTSFGERHESRVTMVEFERALPFPYSVEVIYYDTIDSLIARGILAANDGPNPFPAQRKPDVEFCTPV